MFTFNVALFYAKSRNRLIKPVSHKFCKTGKT